MNVITATNLTIPKPSQAWTQQMRASLAAFAKPGDSRTAGIGVDNWPGPEAVHCLYSVGLQAIINAKALDAFDSPTVWRYMAGSHENGATAAVCWVTPELHGKVVATARAAEAADVLASTALLNKLSEVMNPNNQYEIRVLRVPALCVEAFWLKSTTPGGDVLVPYGLVQGASNQIKLPGGGRLNKNQAYPVADFLKIATEAAKKRLAAEKKPLASKTGA
jgi:hypothetical protein